MGNGQYRRQHYITYHGYKYSLPSVAGFIRQSGIIIYFLRRKYPAGNAAKGLSNVYTAVVDGRRWPTSAISHLNITWILRQKDL